MSEVFHLGLTKAMLDGAKLAIVPGAPERVERIARLLDRPKFLASTREFTSWLGYIDEQAVVVCSTGIGGPSVSIAVEELAQLGVHTFLRIGTTGAIQPHINVGDLLITTAAVRLDGASRHFAPSNVPMRSIKWPQKTQAIKSMWASPPRPTPSIRDKSATTHSPVKSIATSKARSNNGKNSM